MKLTLLTAATFLSGAAAPAQPSFEGIGTAPNYTGSTLRGVSDDGTIATGTLLRPEYPYGWRAFRWTRTNGIEPLQLAAGTRLTNGAGISPDGSVIVGIACDAGEPFHVVPARWINGGPTDRFLGDVESGSATFVSTMGLTIGGSMYVGTGDQGWRYDTTTGDYDGLFTAVTNETQVFAVTADGQRVVGSGPAAHGRSLASYWDNPSELPVTIGELGTSGSRALGVSPDGAIIVGYSGQLAFIWTASSGMQPLPRIGLDHMKANSLTADGSVIVGTRSATSSSPATAVVWTEAGVSDLAVYLTTRGCDLAGWSLTSAVVTPDGRTYAGTGTNPVGGTEGWIAALGTPCLADFDTDGFITGIDYDLYVQAFENGDTSSDFDQDGFITGIDFDLFVAAFEAGC